MICKERPTQSLQLCWKQSNQAPVASMMRGDGAPGAGKLTKTSHICRGTLMSTISRRDDRYNSPSLHFQRQLQSHRQVRVRPPEQNGA